ncbi:MAG: hypothetical protein RIM84_08195 [Alphaproteobacteria bacterium]
MATAKITPPYYPIVYVRGYAGTEGEVEDTVADPYMGFNLGSTKTRVAWKGGIVRNYFESPVIRLMKEFGYRDVYEAGEAMTTDQVIGPQSIVVYRYYDQVSAALGTGERAPIEQFGHDLGTLILDLREKICGDDAAALKAFRIYLVAHSMGGLVVRCFLQNTKLGADVAARKANAEARTLVDKVFTYATPHNGIDAAIVGNVPAILTANNVNNFNRKRMADYLALPEAQKQDSPDDVRSLNGHFDPRRFFCLVGTNARDYAAANGWSSRAVGLYSDGLVRTDNAYVNGPVPGGGQATAPRAYVYRSHSGHFGIVNAEDSYQNLVRFLFGDVLVEGVLEVDELTLPPAVEALRKKDREIRASYHFEVVAGVRGGRWDLSRRLVDENSSIFRRYDELFPDTAAAPPGLTQSARRPLLFSVYLRDAARVAKRRRSLGFGIDLRVLVPDYEVDGRLWMNDHFEGGYLFREKINLEAIPPADEKSGWGLRYGFDSRTPNRASMTADPIPGDGKLSFRIPIEQKTKPGITGTLVLTASPWN